jgi:hypothetical protein
MAKARRPDSRVKAIVLQIDNEEKEMYSFDRIEKAALQ